MYITVHAAAGGAIGQFIGNPFIAFAIGFILHIILDIIPHGDEDIGKWKLFNSPHKRILAAATLDFSALFIFFIYWTLNSPVEQLMGMFAGIVGGVVPDMIWGVHEVTKAPILKKYREWHGKTHEIINKKLTVAQGFALQIPLLIFLTWFILTY